MKSCEICVVGIHLLILTYTSQCLDITADMEGNEKGMDLPAPDAEDYYTEKYAYQINELSLPYKENATSNNSQPAQIILHLLRSRLRIRQKLHNETRKLTTTTTEKYTTIPIEIPEDKRNETIETHNAFTTEKILAERNNGRKVSIIWPWGFLTRAEYQNLKRNHLSTEVTSLEVTTKKHQGSRLERTKKLKKPHYALWWFKRVRTE